MVEFKYELGKILQSLPDNVTGTMKGSIIAKADKMDIDAAMDFIDAKLAEKVIDEKMRDELYRLLKYFTIYR